MAVTNISTLKFQQHSSLSNYLSWFLTSFFYAFQMTLRVLPGIMMDDIMTKFHMDIGQFGLLAGFYYLGYAGAQIPLGLMLDKYNTRFVIAACISTCSLGLVCFSNFETLLFAYLGRLLIGIGSVAGILGAVKTINDFFPQKYSLMLGFTILIGVSGAYYGGAPISALLALYSSSIITNYLAIFGIILAIIIMIFYSNENGSKENTPLTISQAFKLCLANKQIWLIGFLAGLMIGPIEGFADIWGIKYFMQVHFLSSIEASFAASLIFLGLGLGGPVVGFLSNRYISELNIIIICGISLVVCYLILFFAASSNSYIIYLITFAIGLFSAYQVVVFSLVAKKSENKLVGLMSSVINMVIMSFGFIFHYFIGSILENIFEPVIVDNVERFSAHAYHTAFSIIIIGLMLGTAGFFRLRHA